VETVNFYLAKFSNLNIGPEILFGLLVVISLFLFGLSLGRTRALVSLLAVYVAYVLRVIFPYFSELKKIAPNFSGAYIVSIAVFFVFYILAFFILNRTLIKRRLTMSEFSIFWIAFISFLQLGIFVSIVLNLVPANERIIFPEYLSGYFAGQKALFFWLTAPVVVLLLMRREKGSRKSKQD